MKKVQILFTLLFLCTSNFLFSQSPKQRLTSFYSWNHPLINTTQTKLSLILDEKSYPTPLFIEKNIIIPNIETSKNEISPEILNKLNFRTFQLVDNSDADVFLTIHAIPSYFKISAKENTLGYSSGKKEPNYYGILTYNYGAKAILTDSNNTVLYEKEYTQTNELYNISVHNNTSIKSTDTAYKLVKQEFKSRVSHYVKQAFPLQKNFITNSVPEKILLDIDYQRIQETLYLYTYKSKNNENLNLINTSVEETINQLDQLEDSTNYTEKLHEILLPKIETWTNLLPKYDKTDRKQQKIYWGLIANISGAYYALGDYNKALGDYNKALETYQKLDGVKYHNDYTYLKENPEKKIAFLNTPESKDYKNINYTNTHNSELIFFINADGLNDKGITEVEIQKAELLYNIFAVYEFFNSFEDLERKFTEKKGAEYGIGYTEVDDFLVAQMERVYTISAKIKTVDISIYTDEQKFLITEIKEYLFDLISNTKEKFDHLKQDDKSKVSQNIEKLFIFYNELFFDPINKRALNDLIPKLKQELMVYNTKALNQLPYLDFLIDELTTEGKLTNTENPKLYKAIYRDYKEVFFNTIWRKEDFLKYLHHTEVEKVEDIIYNYYNKIYIEEDIENINENLKNIYNPDNSLYILSTFIKQ